MSNTAAAAQVNPPFICDAELTGIKAKKLVIIMACEDGELAVYEEKDVFKWVKKLDEYIRKFVNDKLGSYE